VSVLGIHVDEDAVGGLVLAAMAGDGVAVIDVRPLVDVELNPASGVGADSDVTTVRLSLGPQEHCARSYAKARLRAGLSGASGPSPT